MRKIVAYEMVTLDGFIADEHDGVSCFIQDPEVIKYAQSGRAGTVGMFLFGRVTYDSLASFWPTPEGEKANRYFADSLNNTPKVVVSKKLERPEWQHTTVVRNLDRQTVDNLKQGDGGNIMIFGSGTIVGQLMAMDAIEEYQLLINPIVLGKGKKLFPDIDGLKKLQLAETKTFPSGIVLMNYVKAT